MPAVTPRKCGVFLFADASKRINHEIMAGRLVDAELVVESHQNCKGCTKHSSYGFSSLHGRLRAPCRMRRTVTSSRPTSY